MTTKNKQTALLSGSFNVIDTLVSSTKSFISDSIFLVMFVYVYMRNNKGPNTDPCGTPEGTVLYDKLMLNVLRCQMTY